MPDSVAPAAGDANEHQYVASVLALSTFVPHPDQLAGIRDYLAGIQEAVNELPVCDPVADELEIDFDPRWAEERV